MPPDPKEPSKAASLQALMRKTIKKSHVTDSGEVAADPVAPESDQDVEKIEIDNFNVKLETTGMLTKANQKIYIEKSSGEKYLVADSLRLKIGPLYTKLANEKEMTNGQKYQQIMMATKEHGWENEEDMWQITNVNVEGNKATIKKTKRDKK